MKRRLILLILAICVLLDGLVWFATYRVVTAPSAEELRQAANASSIPINSPVEPKADNFLAHISLNGPWRYKQTGSEMAAYFSPNLDVSDWRTMDIPQNWYLSGLNYHGVIWFRREFEAEANWQGRAVRLQFAGVDYFADVWLNGEKLGRHQGYFQPFTFNVADRLNYGGNNVLVIRVESPYEEYGPVWPHRKTLIKGILAHHDTRPGGAWNPAGQEYNTGGIWNDVELIVSDFVTIDAVQLQATWPTTLTTTTDASLKTHLVLTNHADTPADITVDLTLIPRNFDGETIHLPIQTVTLPPGKTEVNLADRVANPRLWWPWDRGDPNLYTAHVIVASDQGAIAEKETAFGFRQILVGEDWTWTLNGQRFFPRGSNYSSSQWLSQTDEAWFWRDVQLMRAANLNFIRVYAHVEPTEFYEATDELGILVWQDFPLQWGYSDAPDFIDEAQRQMGDMVELLYNHPSIVVWNAHNESPWDAPWMASLVPDYDPRQNKRLDELLRDVARNLDPTRYTHLNSGSGDAHPYPGWDYGQWRDFARLSGEQLTGNGGTGGSVPGGLAGAPLVTEYGAQALPNLEMMQTMFALEELNYQSGEVRDRWEFHNFQPDPTFTIAQIDRGETVAEFITNSQAYQANLIKFATETYRRAKYQPLQGIFHFMFVDNWPSITWSVLDYHRQPKAGFSALQTAMQPILPSIEATLPSRWEGRRWIYDASANDNLVIALWVVNDTLRDYPKAKLRWQLTDNGDPILPSQTILIDIGPDESHRWTVLRDLPADPGTYQLTIELEDAQGGPLGYNEFEFEIKPPEEIENDDEGME